MQSHKTGDALFHILLKQFRLEGVQNKHLLVAVSGGVDSMSLLALLLELQQALKLRLSVVHVHHGARQKKQRAFQDQARQMVKTLCQKNNICFYTNLVKQSEWFNSKHSEADLRKYRYKIFRYFFNKSEVDYLALAHTADDLLETRLIRLIRGTGQKGLSSMSFKTKNLLRPFLNITRSQLVTYIKKRSWTWCEDPSNQLGDTSFRNWIRHNWLPLLEEKRKGSFKALARSLELLAQSNNSSHLEKFSSQAVLCRPALLKLSYLDRQRVLALYLHQRGIKDYGTSHIQELIKRLESPQKQSEFFLLGRKWKMTASELSFEHKNLQSRKNKV